MIDESKKPDVKPPDDFGGRVAEFGISIENNIPIAPYTTFKIGGPATWLAQVYQTTDLIKLCKLAEDFNMPFRVLGSGSNILVSDSGYQGLIILNKCNQWEIAGQHSEPRAIVETTPRFDPPEIIDQSDLGYEDADAEPIHIIADSGIRIPSLISALFKEGITGLQWFAGIPATVGGALYMNAHGGPKFFGDFVHRAWLLDGSAEKLKTHDYFSFDYDWSILHQTREIVTRAELVLRRGDVIKAGKMAKAWAREKSFQPQRSAGCVFRNLSSSQMKQANLSSSSAGYVIDKILGLKGLSCGDAEISENHAAFIENKGRANAADAMRLIRTVQEHAQQKLGFQLDTEIEFLGF